MGDLWKQERREIEVRQVSQHCSSGDDEILLQDSLSSGARGVRRLMVRNTPTRLTVKWGERSEMIDDENYSYKTHCQVRREE